MTSKEQKKLTSKTSGAGGGITVTNTCLAQIALLDDMNYSRVAKAVVSFAETLHRSMGIPVSVAKYTIGDAIVLVVWSGAADSSYVPATDIARVALRKWQATKDFEQLHGEDK